MKNKEQEEAFYTRCAEILGTEYDYKPFPYSKKTRWNNRHPGNGRFTGHGLIRYHSESLVLIHLHTPRLTGQYRADDALDAILSAVQGQGLTLTTC